MSSRPARRRCSITSGTPPARKTWTVAKLRGPLGSASTRRGTRRLMSAQSAAVGRREAGCVGDGGQVQDQVGGAAEGRVRHHGVAQRGFGDDVAHRDSARFEFQRGAGGAARHVEPDRLAGRRQRAVRERHAQRFAHHLRSGGRAQKLASAAGRSAGAASGAGSFFERDLAVSEAHADGLHAGRIFTVGGQQADPSGHQDGGQIARAGERHHHGRQSFVAGGEADHGAAGRQRADQAAEDDGGVVAVRQRIEHAGCALRAAIAGVGAITGERHCTRRLQFLSRGLHQQAHFPVAGVIAQRDGRAIGGANAPMGGEQQHLCATEPRRIPPHAGILRPSEQVARGALA